MAKPLAIALTLVLALFLVSYGVWRFAFVPEPPPPAPRKPAPVVQEPVEEPETQPVSRVSYGTVAVTGDALEVKLVRKGRTYSPGRVPIGTYEVIATFRGRAPSPAGTVTVRTNRTVTLSCGAAFTRCAAQ